MSQFVTYPIRRALSAAHGPAMGKLIGNTQRARIGIISGHIQWTSRGAILWNPMTGARYSLYPGVPCLKKVGAFRDPLGLAGGPAGRIYRSAKLSEATISDRLTLTNLLYGGQILDLRTPGRASKEPDPLLEGVKNVMVSLPPTAYVPYESIVREHRDKLTKIFAGLTHDHGPVLVHCTEGKDRTGIVVALLMIAAGYSEKDARIEFLDTPGAKLHDWRRLTAAMRWDTTSTSLRGWFTDRNGLGLSEADMKKLTARYGKSPY